MTRLTIQDVMQRAAACERAGKWSEAESIYRQVLAQNPKEPAALYGLGMLAARFGHPDSIGLLSQVVALWPNRPALHNNLGVALQGLGRLEEAAQSYRKAIALDAREAGSYSNLSVCLTNLGQVDEAVEAARTATRLAPEFAEAHSNLGNALIARADFTGAVARYRKAIEVQPTFAKAHYHLAMTLLMQGEFEEGWREYEWRHRVEDFPSPRRPFTQERWDGSPAPAAGGTILLYGEQGLGDTIQFARHIPQVIDRGWRVVLECQGPLVRLFERCSHLGAAQVIAMPPNAAAPAVPFDVQLPLTSLPMALSDLDPFRSPAGGGAYLHADPELTTKWRQVLDQELAGQSNAGAGLKIGLAWAGSPTHYNDRNRSIPLALLAQGLFGVAGTQFVGLQFGPAAGQVALLGPQRRIVQFTERIGDFADSAAVLNELDLVITVDTSLAHLAGALGKRVWVLLPLVPDFRWMLERDDTPLYQSMRLFRQKRRGDWGELIARVAAELSRETSAKV